MAAPIVEDSLIHQVKLSITTSEFPEHWKPLNLHPRYKKGDPLKKENQRPVSQIQEVGKLTERAVAHQMIEHMINNDLMCKDQHGAIKDHSPLTALTCIHDLICRGAE